MFQEVASHDRMENLIPVGERRVIQVVELEEVGGEENQPQDEPGGNPPAIP